MAKLEVFICDRCGLRTQDKNLIRTDAIRIHGEGKDLCITCDDQHSGVNEASSHIGSYLTDRWFSGGWDLTGEGAVRIVDIGGHGKKDHPRVYALSFLKLQPLSPILASKHFVLGPYRFESRKGFEDNYGKDGYDIFRIFGSTEKKVAVIRWCKHEDYYRWDYAYAFSKSQPGVLLLNECKASHVTDIEESIQLVIQSLESHFEEWIHNLDKPEGSKP